ncbi:hypothetical protein ACFWN1_23280 [Streptomyces sp. NPDC058459]|uniref:hypothetical protein n=1 Tax=Streptomyces sp. NPDC058459 TaxID=3346508 RepID=UPI003656E431
MSVTPLPRTASTVPLAVAVDQFLDRFHDDPGTRTTYAETLARLRGLVGDQFATGDLTRTGAGSVGCWVASEGWCDDPARADPTGIAADADRVDPAAFVPGGGVKGAGAVDVVALADGDLCAGGEQPVVDQVGGRRASSG